MSKVTGTVLSSFTYKGEAYDEGQDISMDAKHAARYEKLNYVKFNREAAKKVEAVEEKKALTKENAPEPKPRQTK
jgi:hypothetical protein